MSKTDSKLTAKQVQELQALQAMPESEIDYSDIPASVPSLAPPGHRAGKLGICGPPLAAGGTALVAHHYPGCHRPPGQLGLRNRAH